ncbi:hypothetical protein Bbelb_352000 [Branchiostoma belcheri]|nr:hypothetical protein Bbelb_352000 [Branchiostoma belcheri]
MFDINNVTDNTLCSTILRDNPSLSFVNNSPRVTEHWNDPVRNPLLRDFGTCYPVVNGLRALAIQWWTASELWQTSAEWKLAPENECRVKIQLWNSSPDGVSALEQSCFCTRIPVRSFLPHRAPSADATFPMSSALGGQ